MNLPRPDNSAAHRQLVADCLTLLRLRKVWAWANETHGHFNRALGISRKAPGSLNGVADILGCLDDGRLLALEIKTGKARPTKAQREFIDGVNRRGGLALVVRDVRQLDAALTLWRLSCPAALDRLKARLESDDIPE